MKLLKLHLSILRPWIAEPPLEAEWHRAAQDQVLEGSRSKLESAMPQTPWRRLPFRLMCTGTVLKVHGTA